MRKTGIMSNILNLFIPFLLEMLFGSKDDKTTPTPFQKYKRYLAYSVMIVSFSLNYIVVTRLYNVSLLYINLKRENAVLDAKADLSDANKARADQLQTSLEYCMSNTYRYPRRGTKRIPGKL